MWASNDAGVHRIDITYQLGVDRYDSGRSLALPVPHAASVQLTASLPGEGLSVAVIPSSTVRSTEGGGRTTVTASCPSTSGVQISWNTGAEAGLTMSRAVYRGEVIDRAVTWIGEFTVQMGGDESAILELLPADVALLDIQVDGDEAPIEVRSGSFSVALRGRGEHRVTARFQVPVAGERGSPVVSLRVPRVPVSRFELTLAGEKEVSVSPVASVAHTVDEGSTVAVANVPMTDRVSFSWSEAVPEAAVVEEEVQANANIYHTLHADESVLYIDATAIYDITRGETSTFELSIPEGAQINSIVATSGVVSDWRVIEAADGSSDRTVTVYLDRVVSGEFSFSLTYEQLLGPTPEGAAGPEITVPLLSAVGVNRQRGMVALLASREVTLEPIRETSLNRVGENQLPAFLRDQIAMTIAHTFRYFEEGPELAVRPTEPEREQGRFDAQVDTLVSIGDVTTQGAATVEVNVKSGSIMALELELPTGVNFLGLSAPSLRDQSVETRDGVQVIEVEFTQEMEGQFRVEVSFERINSVEGGSDENVAIPTLHVRGAEVEQGRIAIEALSAVEIQPSNLQNLSTVDIGELPQQLILRTTNPILLAFKYVQAEPRPELALRITQHREIDVQAAIIDQANYRTLFTRDGFAVTIARFTVRNSRQQFLRVALPPGADVWSATVNGVAEVPALANAADESGAPEVLINIINSSQGFPVELIYAIQGEELEFMGSVENTLPRPDMVVTHTRWDIFVPDDLDYGEPEADLDIVLSGLAVYGDEMAGDDMPMAGHIEAPIQISVPSSGLQFSFERLYANQSDEPLSVSIPYTSPESADLGLALSLGGTIFVWLGVLGLMRKSPRGPRGLLALAVVLGLATIGGAMGALGAEIRPILLMSLVIVGARFLFALRDRIPAFKRDVAVEA